MSIYGNFCYKIIGPLYVMQLKILFFVFLQINYKTSLCLLVHHDIEAATAAIQVPPIVRMYAHPIRHCPNL